MNDLLIEEKLFLKVYERKSKFRYVIKKGPQKMSSKKISQLVLMSYSMALRLLENYWFAK